jgi:hypothetical protein
VNKHMLDEFTEVPFVEEMNQTSQADEIIINTSRNPCGNIGRFL